LRKIGPATFFASVCSPCTEVDSKENDMKFMTRSLLAVALLGIPTIAIAQTGTKAPAPGPGQSEWAPGQRMNKKDVKGQPGASEYAPGHLPNKDVKK